MHIETDRALIPAGESAVRYLTATITAPESGRRTERPAVGVGLVVDRSGSMAGRKLEMARKAVAHAIQLLSGRDRLALVVYDHEVETLLGQAPGLARKQGPRDPSSPRDRRARVYRPRRRLAARPR